MKKIVSYEKVNPRYNVVVRDMHGLYVEQEIFFSESKALEYMNEQLERGNTFSLKVEYQTEFIYE